ncbi:hypothetical protein [Serratia liquefaciens]|uniref:hypothetical protein n=1 Tax=Serratia liquefaciens TaxID=614 RepID=UPI0005CB6FBB|nr:hypothetical protein [Serratia liquefaciens]GAK25863.1 hypothetical protein SLIQ_04250 [Serratia liquefaciens FK01]
MSKIDVSKVADAMILAAKKTFQEEWPIVADYATMEFKKLAFTLAQIQLLYDAEKITDGEASVLFEMQKNAAKAVMAGLAGMTLILVEQVLNAALDAARGIVNTAIGFSIL